MQPPSPQLTSQTGAPWVFNFGPDMARPVGGQVAFLMLRMRVWIHRRVESIEFLDDVNVRRKVSVDFTVPRNVRPLTDLEGRLVTIAPIAMLRKERLPRFDFRDEEGRAVPLLRADDDAKIYAEALIRIFEGRINRPLEEEVREAVRALTRAEKEQAAEAAVWFSTRGEEALVTRRLLARDATVQALLADAAKNFPVLVRLEWEGGNGTGPAHPPGRRIFKFAYDEKIPDEPATARFLQSLGWRARRARVQAHGVGDAASYHLGVASPLDVEILRARLLLDEAIQRARLLPNSGSAHPPLDDPDEHSTVGAHLMARDVPARSEGVAVVEMRVRRAGLLRASVLNTAFIAAVVTIGAVRLVKLDKQSSDVDVLLIAIPGLLAAYLARPGEHILASRLLVGVRLVVATAGLVAFAAAGSLIALGSGRPEAVTWYCLAGAAWFLAGCTFLSYILPRRGRRE